MRLVSIFVLITLISHSLTADFYYSRSLNCISLQVTDQALGISKCMKWEEQTVISYLRNFLSYCFSENTHVMTI